MDLVHKYGQTFKQCSVYVGTEENWDKNRELVYRRGHYNKDHSAPVGTTETPIIRVMYYGRQKAKTNAYIEGTRKKKK